MSANNEDELTNDDAKSSCSKPTETTSCDSNGIGDPATGETNPDTTEQQLTPPNEDASLKDCKTEQLPAEIESNEKVECRTSKSVHIDKKLNSLHCPFVWQADLHINTYGDHDYDLLADAEEMFEETGFRFRRFVVNLVLCYHNFYKRLIKECLQNLEELERMLAHTSKRETADVLFNTINDALFHVIHSSRLHIMVYVDQKNKNIPMMFSKIEPYDSMNDANKAGIWGIRASVYVEYGYEGVVAAVDYVQKAIDLDSKNPFWPFMKGTYLSRLRRMVNGFIMPTVEEVSALEKAMSLREDPAFLAYSAEVYLEMAKIGKKLYREKFSGGAEDTVERLFSQLDMCNDKATLYFKRSVELKPNSAHLLFRCGKGLMRLPPPYQDLEEAKHYLDQGLKLAPKSSFGNHAMAMYFEKYKRDPEAARKHLTVSVNRKNFQAHMDALRINFVETEDHENLIRELKEMLELYTDTPKQRKLLGELVCYYLFQDYDLVEACVHMKKLIYMRNKFNDVQKFRSILPFTGPIPLQDILLGEIGYRYRQKNISEEEKNVYKKFIDFLLSENITVPDRMPTNLLPNYAADLQKGLKRLKSLKKTSQSRDTKEKLEKTNSISKLVHKDPKAHEYHKYYCDHEDAGTSSLSRLLSRVSLESDDSEDANAKVRLAKKVSSRDCRDVEKSKKNYSSGHFSSKSESGSDCHQASKHEYDKYRRRDTKESRKKHRSHYSSDESSSEDRSSDDDHNNKNMRRKRERDPNRDSRNDHSDDRKSDKKKLSEERVKSPTEHTALGGEKYSQENKNSRKPTSNVQGAVPDSDPARPSEVEALKASEKGYSERARKHSSDERVESDDDTDDKHSTKAKHKPYKSRSSRHERSRSSESDRSSDDSGRSSYSRHADRERAKKNHRDERERRRAMYENDVYDRSERTGSCRRSDRERDKEERRRADKHSRRYYDRESDKRSHRYYRRKESVSPPRERTKYRSTSRTRSDRESSLSPRPSSRRSRK